MSIISLVQYIAEYCNISQCSTIGLRTQSKYASIILKIFSAVTHNTHVDDTKHQLNTLCNISNNRNVFVGNNRNTVFQYRATLIETEIYSCLYRKFVLNIINMDYVGLQAIPRIRRSPRLYRHSLITRWWAWTVAQVMPIHCSLKTTVSISQSITCTHTHNTNTCICTVC